jgi:hypothetical protein
LVRSFSTFYLVFHHIQAEQKTEAFKCSAPS